MSDPQRPHGLQPSSLLHPWDFPGKSTGVGCHFLLQCRKVKSESEVAQSCLTLSDPMDCSLPGSSIHGIFQARVLEWGAIASPKGMATNSCILAWRIPWTVEPGRPQPMGSQRVGPNLRKQHFALFRFPTALLMKHFVEQVRHLWEKTVVLILPLTSPR